MTSLVTPTAVLVLAHQRLADATEVLGQRMDAVRYDIGFGLGTRRVVRTNTERRVLGMALAARRQMEGGPVIDLPTANRQFPGPSQLAVAGTSGFELPGYSELFAPGGTWRAGAMRRGSPDPDLSHVVVPTTQVAVRTGELGVAAASSDGDKAAAAAFAHGMLAAVASGVVVGPVQRGAHAARTKRPWTHRDPVADLRQVDRLALRRLVGGTDPAARWRSWWPAPSAVPDPVWTGLVQAIEEAYRFDAARPRGWPSFETGFVAGESLDARRMRAGYRVLRADQEASTWPWWAWWLVLSPAFLVPSVALLAARGLPAARRFLEPGELDERAWTELLTLSLGLGGIAPAFWSMYLWTQVDEHTEPFVNAAVLGLLRLAGMIAFAATIGDEAVGPSSTARWLLLSGMLATDVYGFVRGLLAGGLPGHRFVHFLQVTPFLVTTATAGWAGLGKLFEIEGDKVWPWLGLVTAVGTFGVGLPIALALGGTGWSRWFIRDRPPRLAVLTAVDAAADVGEPSGHSLAFDDSSLWVATNRDAPSLADMRYPAGPKSALRIWWTGPGTLRVAHDDHTVKLRRGTNTRVVTIGLHRRTAAAIAQEIRAELPELTAEIVDETTDLPWPHTLGDPGDQHGDLAGHLALADTFVDVGTDRAHAYTIALAPREEQATAVTFFGPASALSRIRFVPDPTIADSDQTALGAAADLCVLLALGAAPSLGRVLPAKPAAAADLPAVGPVFQVFRQWNLDERRLNEWRMLVASGAESEKGADPAVRDPAMRPDPRNAAYHSAAAAGHDLAAAMGWVPLWRAWLHVAEDLTADGDADIAMDYTPEVSFPDGTRRRPTNRQLTEGVRFVLDLP